MTINNQRNMLTIPIVSTVLYLSQFPSVLGKVGIKEKSLDYYGIFSIKKHGYF